MHTGTTSITKMSKSTHYINRDNVANWLSFSFGIYASCTFLHCFPISCQELWDTVGSSNTTSPTDVDAAKMWKDKAEKAMYALLEQLNMSSYNGLETPRHPNKLGTHWRWFWQRKMMWDNKTSEWVSINLATEHENKLILFNG